VFSNQLELTLWSGVLLIAGGFQFYRGAPDDGVIFGFGALFLIANRFYPERFTLKIPRLASAVILAIASVIAALSRIHTRPQLLAMFLFALILLFGKRTAITQVDKSQKTHQSLVRSRVVYALIAALCSVWEMVSYVLETHKQWGNKFPTISDLASPMLFHTEGRIFFVACFAAVGYVLMFKQSTPPESPDAHLD
jgi:intracellular septation protein A